MAAQESKSWTGGAERLELCPQCFSTHYYNDVLFTADNWTTGRCDVRQAIHRATFDRDGYDAWCAAGHSQAVRTWRGAAPEDLRMLGDAVLGVRDPGGTWLNRRVCPVCHSILPVSLPVLFGWNAKGMDNEIVRQVFAQADKDGTWHAAQRENPGVLPYEWVQRQRELCYLSVPVGLEKASTRYGKECKSNCCLHAPGVLLELRMNPGEDDRLDVGPAERAVASLLEQCQYSSTALKKAVVCLVRAPEEEKDPVGRLERQDKQLLLRMQYSFTDVLVAAYPLEPHRCTEILDWLVKKCGS